MGSDLDPPHRRNSDVDIAILSEGMKHLGETSIRIQTEIESMARNTERQFEKANDKLDTLLGEDLPRRVEKIESVISWGGRLIVGAVLIALLAVVIKSGSIP